MAFALPSWLESFWSYQPDGRLPYPPLFPVTPVSTPVPADDMSAMWTGRSYAANQAIVKLTPDTDLASYAGLVAAAGAASVESLGAGFEIWHLSSSFEQAYGSVGGNSHLELFQPDYAIGYSDFVEVGNAAPSPDNGAERVPNDPGYGSTYGLGKISAPAAWDITTGGPVTVAVHHRGGDW